MCDWKRRFNSAAFKKLSHRPGGGAGLFTAKVVPDGTTHRARQIEYVINIVLGFWAPHVFGGCPPLATIKSLFYFTRTWRTFVCVGAVLSCVSHCAGLTELGKFCIRVSMMRTSLILNVGTLNVPHICQQEGLQAGLQ